MFSTINCAALYGLQSKCINTFGSYVCTPFITIEDPPVNVPSAYGYIAYNSDTREVMPDNEYSLSLHTHLQLVSAAIDKANAKQAENSK